MANDCNFYIKAKGKQENLEKFYEILNNPYHVGDESNPPHMYRIFDVFDCDYYINDDGEIIADITGYCAWSVYSCMFDGSTTYYADWAENDVNATSITQLSYELGLTIEIFSEEPGMCFSEHYIIDNGEVTLDETANLRILTTTDFDYEYFKDSDTAELSDEERTAYVDAKREYVLKEYGSNFTDFFNSIDDYDLSMAEDFYVCDHCDFLGNFNFTLF